MPVIEKKESLRYNNTVAANLSKIITPLSDEHLRCYVSP